MKKTYTKTGKLCRVTFSLPAEVNAKTVAVCGEFNDWNAEKNPLKRRKNGSFSATISLKPGASYRFRYLVDGERWENDWAADEYLPNEFGSEDSVVVVWSLPEKPKRNAVPRRNGVSGRCTSGGVASQDNRHLLDHSPEINFRRIPRRLPGCGGDFYSKVVFPQPLGPIKPTRSPGLMLKEMSASILLSG